MGGRNATPCCGRQTGCRIYRVRNVGLFVVARVPLRRGSQTMRFGISFSFLLAVVVCQKPFVPLDPASFPLVIVINETLIRTANWQLVQLWALWGEGEHAPDIGNYSLDRSWCKRGEGLDVQTNSLMLRVSEVGSAGPKYNKRVANVAKNPRPSLPPPTASHPFQFPP